MLDVIDEIYNMSEQGKKFPIADCLAIIEFLQGYADKFHHGKEEDLLFPNMVKRGIPSEGGPIGVMLQEHDLGRSIVRSMKKFTSDYTEEVTNYTQFITDGKAFIDLLRKHIYKEDNILYNMADQALTDSDQIELLGQYKTVDNSREMEYIKMVETLKMKYLKS